MTTSEMSSSNMANVDPSEIAKFSAMAATWWDLSGSFRLIHKVNPLRTDYIKRMFLRHTEKKSLQGVKAIDVGCGAGILTEALAQQGALMTGLDMSYEALQAGKLHAQQGGLNINYVQQAVEEFAAQHEGEFELVTCMEMLEHVPDVDSVLSALCRMLRPGGVLVLSTINQTAMAQLQMIEVVENWMQWLPRGTHLYHKFIKPAQLVVTAQNLGLECVDVVGYKLNPFTQNFYLDRNVNVNYMIAFHKPQA